MKKVRQYVMPLFMFAFGGLLLVGSESTPGGEASGNVLLGGLIFLGSPIWAAVWVWLLNNSPTDNALEELQAEERMKEQERLRKIQVSKLMQAVVQHRAALSRNLANAYRSNDYGKVVEDRRVETFAEFFDSIDLDHKLLNWGEAMQLTKEKLSRLAEADLSRGFNPNTLPSDGHEFEHWVAKALSTFGWDAQVTSASGDQGIDVVASLNGKRIGLQCKLYSSPIGNKAVQEAHAGKFYHGVDEVAVLSNAGFTRSARTLANATGVTLLSQHDIPRLEELMFGGGS